MAGERRDLFIECTVNLPDDQGERIIQIHHILRLRGGEDEQWIERGRRRAFADFDQAMIRGLIKRGWFYGSTIGTIRSHEFATESTAPHWRGEEGPDEPTGVVQAVGGAGASGG